MAFTANHVQGIFGEFKPVADGAGGTLTVNQVQGVLGEFEPVLDNAQTAGGAPAATKATAFMTPNTLFWGP